MICDKCPSHHSVVGGDREPLGNVARGGANPLAALGKGVPTDVVIARQARVILGNVLQVWILRRPRRMIHVVLPQLFEKLAVWWRARGTLPYLASVVELNANVHL